MDYNELRQLVDKIDIYKRYNRDFLPELDIEAQISNAFSTKVDIEPPSIVMLDIDNPIMDIARMITDNIDLQLEVVENIALDIIHHYVSSLDLDYVYDAIYEMDTIANEEPKMIPINVMDRAIDYMYTRVFIKVVDQDIVYFNGFIAESNYMVFMVN